MPLANPLLAALEQKAAFLGIDPLKLRLAHALGELRLRVIREAAQQQYFAAYAEQLALIMEAAEAQAEMAKQNLDDEKEEHDWRRKRNAPMCSNWQRGYCKLGDACQYAHPDKEFGSSSNRREPADLMRYNFKTAMCRLHSQGNC